MPSLSRRSVIYSQNFIRDPSLVSHMLDECSIGSNDILYEIGPGKGLITEQLVHRCRQVVAIEKDPLLVETLRHKFTGASNITIHEGDFLQFRLPSISYKVFANIPFNITTAIMTKLTTASHPPEDAYLVVQKEAADKFLGQPRESLYAVLVKPWFELDIVYHFQRSDFAPSPRVDVVMLRLRKRGPPLIHRNDTQLYRDFVVYGFTTWQPSLNNTFKDIFTPRQFRQIAKKLDCDPSVTPSLLQFEQWLKLFEHFKGTGNTCSMQKILGSEKRLRQQQARLQKIHQTRVPRRTWFTVEC